MRKHGPPSMSMGLTPSQQLAALLRAQEEEEAAAAAAAAEALEGEANAGDANGRAGLDAPSSETPPLAQRCLDVRGRGPSWMHTSLFVEEKMSNGDSPEQGHNGAASSCTHLL